VYKGQVLGSLIGIKGFYVSMVARDMPVEQKPVTAEDVTGVQDHLPRGGCGVQLGGRRLRESGLARFLQAGQPPAHELHARDVGEHLRQPGRSGHSSDQRPDRGGPLRVGIARLLGDLVDQLLDHVYPAQRVVDVGRVLVGLRVMSGVGRLSEMFRRWKRLMLEVKHARQEPFLERVGQELLRIDPAQVRALADAMWECHQAGRTIFLIGNGGSGSNASHFCEDLGKGTLTRADFDNDKKKRLRVLSLTDNTPYILAWGNDEGFDRVFLEQLKNLASPGDLLIAIRGSATSPNILRAAEWANRRGLTTFGCTGVSCGKLRTLDHHNFHVPLEDIGIVESIHLTAFHWIVDDLYRRISLQPQS